MTKVKDREWAARKLLKTAEKVLLELDPALFERHQTCLAYQDAMEQAGSNASWARRTGQPPVERLRHALNAIASYQDKEMYSEFARIAIKDRVKITRANGEDVPIQRDEQGNLWIGIGGESIAVTVR